MRTSTRRADWRAERRPSIGGGVASGFRELSALLPDFAALPCETNGVARDGSSGAPALPAWKAFVVQFAADAAVRGPCCSGRIEHLSSGRRVRFASKEELVEVLGRLLDELGEDDE